MRIRRLHAGDAPQYRTLMLEAYRDEPEAFTSTEAERAQLPFAWWQKRIGESTDNGSPNNVAFGAFHGDALIGSIALEFGRRERTAHKGSLVGMYVRPGARAAGVGRALVEAALAYARERPGASVVQLTYTEGNHAAEKLYEAAGFVRFGVEPLAIRYPDGYRSKVHLWFDLRRSQ